MNYYIRSGIFAGLVIVAFRLAVFYSGSYYLPIGRYANLVDFLIMLPAIFWGIKSKKEREMKDNYIMKEAVKGGLQVVLAISLTVTLYMYIFYTVAMTDLLAQTQNVLISMHTEASKIPGILANDKLFFDPFHQATFSLFMHLIFGIILSILCAALLGQKK